MHIVRELTRAILKPVLAAEYRAANAARLAAAQAAREARTQHRTSAHLEAVARSHCKDALRVEMQIRGPLPPLAKPGIVWDRGHVGGTVYQPLTKVGPA